MHREDTIETVIDEPMVTIVNRPSEQFRGDSDEVHQSAHARIGATLIVLGQYFGMQSGAGRFS
jgi:hypothetical protein